MGEGKIEREREGERERERKRKRERKRGKERGRGRRKGCEGLWDGEWERLLVGNKGRGERREGNTKGSVW